MSDNTNRHLQTLTDLLIEAYPEGAKTGDLAETLGVSGQTIRNYIVRLGEMGIPVQDLEGRRYAVDPGDYISPLRLTQAQGWFLYLLLRRIVRADLGRYALVNRLLQRLSANLHGELADQIAPDEVSVTDWDDTINTLVEGWRLTMLVRIQYSAPNSTAPLTHIVAPYWFEPAPWSDSNYLIAGVRGNNGRYSTITFKLDRVRSALLLKETFERPPADELLGHIHETWGIWAGNDPVEVVLRFNNRVADRLRETRWHPSQQLTLDAEGYILWRALIAEPQEMLPWIRGWGADVEVLSPADLRQHIADEAVHTAQLYGKKTDKQERRFF